MWGGQARALLAAARHCALLLLMNAGTLSYGLALGWISLASGEAGYAVSGDDGEGGGGGDGGGGDGGGAQAGLVWGAASTFAGALLGVAVSAHALLFPRKLALLLVSILFTMCWTVTLVSCGAGGGAWRWWGVGAGRVCAGVAGNLAWCIAPVFAKEMSVCAGYAGGAGACVPAVAHNVGMLLMYLAADCNLHPQVVVWWCCVVSALHCVLVVAFVPESPAFLAAHSYRKEALEVMCWLRGGRCEEAGLAALPAPHTNQRSTLTVFKDLWRSGRSTRRLVVVCVCLVAGQQVCGVLSLEQFAERAFVMLRAPAAPASPDPTLTPASPDFTLTPATPAIPGPTVTPVIPASRFALILGAAQLVASLVALYLVDRFSHRVLLVCSGACTSVCLAVSAAAEGAGGAAALVLAAAADSLGLHPVPYAVVTDLFHYEERGAVLCASYVAEELVSGLQTAAYAGLAGRGGVRLALGVAAIATALYALAAAAALPARHANKEKHHFVTKL